MVDGAQEKAAPETEVKKLEQKKKGSGMKLQSGKSSEINWDEIEAEVQKEDNGGGWGKDVKCMNQIPLLKIINVFWNHWVSLTALSIQIEHFTKQLDRSHLDG